MKHELTPLSPLFFSCRSPSSHSFPVLSFPSPFSFSSRPSPLLSPLPLLSAPSPYPFPLPLLSAPSLCPFPPLLLSAPSLYPFSLQAALEHPWFAEAPLPQEKDKMPSFQVCVCCVCVLCGVLCCVPPFRCAIERTGGEDRGRGQGERTGREERERGRGERMGGETETPKAVCVV